MGCISLLLSGIRTVLTPLPTWAQMAWVIADKSISPALRSLQLSAEKGTSIPVGCRRMHPDFSHLHHLSITRDIYLCINFICHLLPLRCVLPAPVGPGSPSPPVLRSRPNRDISYMSCAVHEAPLCGIDMELPCRRLPDPPFLILKKASSLPQGRACLSLFTVTSWYCPQAPELMCFIRRSKRLACTCSLSQIISRIYMSAGFSCALQQHAQGQGMECYQGRID